MTSAYISSSQSWQVDLLFHASCCSLYTFSTASIPDRRLHAIYTHLEDAGDAIFAMHSVDTYGDSLYISEMRFS